MIKKIAERPLAAVSILIIFSLYLFFFQLGGMALTDPDETFYAQTAKEMVSRGEWITPYLYGNPQFEKPILCYWLIEISYKAFGVNEFAARFPSAVFAMLGVIALYFLGSILFNRKMAFLASLMLATCVEYIILSRACITDMVLATFMLSGFLFFFYGTTSGKRYFYLLSAAAFALATLTKGPVAIILAGTILLIYLALNRDWGIFRKMPLFSMCAVFFAVTMPWYIIVYKIHGTAFTDAFFGFHNVNRFLEAEHAIGSQIYYNIPVVFGGFFPWSVFLPIGFWFAIAKWFKAPDTVEAKSCRFILIWFFVIFVFFTISSTKLATYIFPLFPALALMAAYAWDVFLREEASSRGVRIGMKISYYFLAIGALIGGIVAPIAVGMKYPALEEGVLASASFLVFGFMLSFVAFKKKKYPASIFLIFYSVAIFLYPLDRLVLPEVERQETSVIMAKELLKRARPGERVGSESNYLAGLAFYADKVPVNIDRYGDLVNFLASGERVWCVLKEKNHRQLYELDTKPYYTKPSYMVYKLGKKCIVTNLPPEDGRFLIKRERKDGKI